MTIRDAYNQLSSVLEPLYGDREGNIMARYLVEDLFARPFYNEDDLTPVDKEALHQAILRLENYEPWQYVGGIADFYGLRFKLNPSVLIPRPETEELVYRALAEIKTHSLASVMDIGTGSGIIPVTIGLKSPGIQLTAVDVSAEALEVARSNAEKHGVQVEFVNADFLDHTVWSRLPAVDLIVSNPPYIGIEEKASMHPNVLDHEPHLALFTNGDPLEFYDAMARFITGYQKPGCRLLAEISEYRGQRAADLFVRYGFEIVSVVQDMQGKDRILTAVWKT